MDNPNVNDSKTVYVYGCCAPGTGQAVFWGIVLILLGGLGLISAFAPLQHLGRYILPAFLVLWGIDILFSRRTRSA